MYQVAVRLELELTSYKAGCLPTSRSTKSVGKVMSQAMQKVDCTIVVKLQRESSSSCAPPVPCHQQPLSPNAPGPHAPAF